MFKKQLDEGMAGDNAGILLRGIPKEDVERGMVLAKPGSITPAHGIQGLGVRAEQGRGRQGIRRSSRAIVRSSTSARRT